MKQLRRDKVLEILREHKAELADRYGVISLGIFGSVARDEAKADSDVDIIVKLEKPGLFALAHLREELMSILECDVDLVHESQYMRPFLRNKIDLEGIMV